MSDLKIYESRNLITAMKERANGYRKVKQQLEPLRKAFREIVHLTDFQGKTAEAIKGFYQAQIDVLDAWERFWDTHIAILEDTERAAEELNLSGNTVVHIPFLQETLLKTDRKSNGIVSEKEEELTRIFHRIDDLISLNVFSRESFDQQMHLAEKERKDTIEKVQQLDRQLVKEYQESETQESYVLQLFMQLMEASGKNGAISPVYFDSKAYHNSEVYQLKDEAEKQKKQYLAFKGKQDISWWEAQVEEEKQKRPWYEKVWSGVLIGSGNAVEDTVEGLKAIADIRKLANDPVNTLKSSYQSAINMPEYIWNAVTTAWDRDVIHGDAESRTAFFTYGLTSIGISVLGDKGITKIGTAGKVSNIAAHSGKYIPKIRNYHELSLVGVPAVQGVKPVPYNVMNNLLVQIKKSVDEVYGSDKGKGNSDKRYNRPSRFRKGVRDKVWEKAKETDGNVRDPLTETIIKKDEPWDMGHKPGYEFRKHQQSAMDRGISRKEFLDEHNNPDHYRPELPSSNRSHKGEDLTDDYFGD